MAVGVFSGELPCRERAPERRPRAFWWKQQGWREPQSGGQGWGPGVRVDLGARGLGVAGGEGAPLPEGPWGLETLNPVKTRTPIAASACFLLCLSVVYALTRKALLSVHSGAVMVAGLVAPSHEALLAATVLWQGRPRREQPAWAALGSTPGPRGDGLGWEQGLSAILYVWAAKESSRGGAPLYAGRKDVMRHAFLSACCRENGALVQEGGQWRQELSCNTGRG